MKGIITVDIGTTSVRGALYDADGRLIHMDARENAPGYFNDGRVEQDAAAWAGILPEVLKSCADAAASARLEPACVSVTAQRSSVIPIDRDGIPLHPAVMWQDRRAAGLAQAMAACEAQVYRACGLKISPVFSAIKMTWFKRHRPDIWKRTRHMIGIQDWALYLLTGRLLTDHSFASRTSLLNLESRQWDAELLRLFEVPPGMLCELVAPGAVAGGLLPGCARETGLPPGLPVITAGGDQQCAALGLGLFSGERAVTNTGTGSYLIGHSAKPALDERMRTACNVSAVPDAYIVEAAVLTSGMIYRWFAGLGSGGANMDAADAAAAVDAAALSRLNAEAAAAPPGANGLILLPHFRGCGAPHWDPAARGVFYNLTLGTTRGEMARAILEGIAVEMKESLELVEALCGRVATVSVSGGLTRSELFNQIQSDVFDRAVVRFGNGEATSFGAWIAGAVACGIDASHARAFARALDADASVSYRPNPENLPLYERQCRRARALYRALAAPGFREETR
ncbi:MAG: carbohydrate kinase [Candidatus Accumulibacter sp.]|jgi:sugar (pentulose or hexulose) kinase|nr:carbohydrate kinase [Accumulibacter sp.]